MGAFVECTHQTPYYSCVTCQAKRCTLCREKEAAVAAALDSFKEILDRMSDAPIPDDTCSNADQEEGYHDGICCAFNFIYKELRALTPTQTSALEQHTQEAVAAFAEKVKVALHEELDPSCLAQDAIDCVDALITQTSAQQERK